MSGQHRDTPPLHQTPMDPITSDPMDRLDLWWDAVTPQPATAQLSAQGLTLHRPQTLTGHPGTFEATITARNPPCDWEALTTLARQLRPLVAAIRETDPWRDVRKLGAAVAQMRLPRPAVDGKPVWVGSTPVWPTPAVPVSWAGQLAWELGAIDDSWDLLASLRPGWHSTLHALLDTVELIETAA